MARVRENLGQLRPVGPEINQYSMVSVWPPPFAREQQLINRDQLITLKPPTIVVDWPDSIQPPNIPSADGEDYEIKRDMRRVLWPRKDEYGGPYSLNEPRGYKPNWTMNGLGQAGKPFPMFEYTLTAAGLFTGVSGIRNDKPILSLLGTLMAIAGIVGIRNA